MKKNHSKYEQVTKLPSNALPVKEYADKEGISTSWVYKQWREQKAKFKIVTYYSINFVIPK